MTTTTGTTTVDARDVYRRASIEFGKRVHRIGGRWSAPTPCQGWDVRAMLHHVVEEELWAPALFAGATIGEVGDRFAGDVLGSDPVRAFDEASAAAIAAVVGPGALERTVHLSFGDVPGREYAMQLAADHLVHAWDIARAIGDDPALDLTAVTVVRDWFAGMEDAYRQAGAVGPRSALPDDPGPQDELLAMFGRDPRARPGTDGAADAVERFNRAFDAKDVDAVMAAMTPDCVFEDTTPPDGQRHVGAAAVRMAWERLFAASPDAVFTTEARFTAGDHVVQRWRYDFAGGHVRGVDLFTVRDGLVAEKLSYVKG